jgi:hypothetical protein
MKLSEAKALAQAARGNANKEVASIISRINEETGGDIQEISDMLKATETCHACVVEGQEHTCESIGTKKLGRRLMRLIERANH